MTGEVCSFSELPRQACGHCRTAGASSAGDAPRPSRSRSFVARYDGHCATRCGWPIEQGERIRYDDDGRVVHARCG